MEEKIKAALRCFFLWFAVTIPCVAVNAQSPARLEFLSLAPKPVIGKHNKDARGNRFGFEGGSSQKVGNSYYIFTTEIFAEPKTAATRLALWRSKNGTNFKRIYQLAETNFKWDDSVSHLMSPWSPMLVFDSLENRWSVFHVGYRRKPGSTDVYNMGGRIRRYDSTVKGVKGIEGPYQVGGWLNIDPVGPAWEGLGGLVSFSAYPIGKEWYGFIGSNTVPVIQDPKSGGGASSSSKVYFRASLAKADKITGRWNRISELNPVLIDDEFIENSIVTKISDSLYINVYDGSNTHELSYSVSRDGLHWSKEKLMSIPNAPDWLHKIRTPLGLIHERGNIYRIYFTAFDGHNEENILPLWHLGYGNVGMMKVKLIINDN